MLSTKGSILISPEQSKEVVSLGCFRIFSGAIERDLLQTSPPAEPEAY
jgi:hypothetical protein